MYNSFWKRLLDLIFASILIIMLSPLFLLCSVILFFNNKGAGIFFTQERVGRGRRIFKIVKFKTMTDERHANGELLSDSDRLTHTGKLFRRTSLDELPQLINILQGEMSFIGPRPLLIQYLPYYTEHEHLRHTIRPGITGWAQVHGRNSVCWEERFKKDVWYVNNCSLRIDVTILYLTVKNIITREGLISNADTISTFKNLDDERSNQNKS